MKKMKKILCLVFALGLVLALCACGNTNTPAATDEGNTDAQQTASAAPADGEKVVFKHGFDLDYPPYSYVQEDGTVGGFDVELCQALCERLGWEYEAVPFNWDAKDAELNAGSCDCIWSGFTVEGRENDYTWSFPYSKNTQMILVPEDSDIKTLDDLAGKVVGVQTATSAYDLLNDDEGQAELCKTFSSLEVFETYTIAFTDLQAGAIDAIAIDVTTGSYLMSKNPGYKFLDDVLGQETYAIGFRLEDTELRDQVEAGLMELVKDGTFDKIGQKYPDIYDYLCLSADAADAE